MQTRRERKEPKEKLLTNGVKAYIHGRKKKLGEKG